MEASNRLDSADVDTIANMAATIYSSLIGNITDILMQPEHVREAMRRRAIHEAIVLLQDTHREAALLMTNGSHIPKS